MKALAGLPGLVVDNFAGGGGASTGIEEALRRAVDMALNHDEDAIRMHEANHPGTMHIKNNVWQIDPVEVVRELYAKVANDNPARRIEINPITRLARVMLAWFSPDCKHFSKAKGGKPREKSIRDLAWVVVLWAKRVRPDVILLENVEEFRTWGPLCDEGKPIKERAGETFDQWCKELRKLGYKIEFRELRACDYGAPTIRKRFFMVARCDGKPISWPEPTHGKPDSVEVLSGKRQRWRTAADIIDWSIPCPSIFERKKPLAEKTLRRIAHGIMKFVVDTPTPFIVPEAKIAAFSTYAQQGGRNRPVDTPLHTVTASKKDHNCVVAANLVHVGNGERVGQAPRAMDAERPLNTVVAGAAKHAVVSAFLQKFAQNGKGSDPAEPVHTVMAGAPRHAVMVAHLEQANGGPRNLNLAGRAAAEPLSTVTCTGSKQRIATSSLVKLRGTSRHGQPVDEPLHTISAAGTHFAEVRAFLIKYFKSAAHGQGVDEPMHSLTTKPRFGLITVSIRGEDYVIVDIGMRMLTKREQFNAQGFSPDYIIDHDVNGRPITETAQQAKCGNSVCPPLAEALVRANFADFIEEREAVAA